MCIAKEKNQSVISELAVMGTKHFYSTDPEYNFCTSSNPVRNMYKFALLVTSYNRTSSKYERTFLSKQLHKNSS